ncbi:hypothetical protein LLEC1_03446 [Akanthomyces lecanii]|uniref:Aminoglycoside phosphotransferase domain-containing protein n=1 Tax=Cordyceps confragosa TaxID=2714763 RepID=A0A179II02_CORDF|nr:hypothetical protein LLEC1_03446 [Akanthomyces lecanii]
MPLTPERLRTADRSVRSQLFRQIFGVFAQLRQLNFDTIGSLMPGRSEEKPLVGNLLTFAMNEIPGAQLPAFSTAQEFMQSQFDVVRQHSALPTENLEESDARFELFAIYTLEKYFTVPDKVNHAPFVLQHPDLRLQNIIVNDDLEVQAVIDWEFAHVVPLPLFVPPPWATGHDFDFALLSALFQLELRDAAASNTALAQLRHEWYQSKSNAFHIAHIVRYPSDVSTVFDEFFAKPLFGDDVDKAEADFFNAHMALNVEARRRAQLRPTPCS